ncbi:hypothetical protein I4U23_018234 [Adineta vaga]|nr:hypothetical protein I4U23_018234 [Adineta vaga]
MAVAKSKEDPSVQKTRVVELERQIAMIRRLNLMNYVVPKRQQLLNYKKEYVNTNIPVLNRPERTKPYEQTILVHVQKSKCNNEQLGLEQQQTEKERTAKEVEDYKVN